MTSGIDYHGKRALDLVVALVAIAVTLPIQALVAVLVQATSSGPVLHRAMRVGRHGRAFVLYKFRSMTTNSADSGPAITAHGDPRVTKVGRLLRRTKFDELPQLFNVVKGDMSIVGPRPEDQRYVDRYTDEQREILHWRPGMTSPASVSYRNEEQMLASAHDLETAYADISAQKLAIDIAYFRSASLVGDIEWMWRTVHAVVRSRGA